MLHSVLRVNHAGEAGAIRIYQGQIASGRSGAHRGFLAETLAHERDHFARFGALMTARGIRPCGALPLWGLGGWLLGWMTGLLGPRAVMTCTEAIERAVHRHLEDQVAVLHRQEPEVCAVIAEIGIEELGHLEFAKANRGPQGWFERTLDGAITAATEILIFASTYGESARMARSLRKAQP